MTEMVEPELVLYRRSAELGELFSALAKAQGAFAPAEKAGTSNFGKHTTLDSVFEATKAGRQANGLAIIQMPGNLGDAVAVTTILGHASGQWIESIFSVRPAKFDAQGAGSVVTYLRRYSLMSILGIAPEDDDGDAAGVDGPRTRTTPRPAAAVARAAMPKSPEPPKPPHDPTTGEVLPPHELERAGSYIEWGATFIAAIKTAKTHAELDEWQRLNNAALATIAENAPKPHQHIKATLNQLAAKIGPPDEPGAEFATVEELKGVLGNALARTGASA